MLYALRTILKTRSKNGPKCQWFQHNSLDWHSHPHDCKLQQQRPPLPAALKPLFAPGTADLKKLRTLASPASSGCHKRTFSLALLKNQQTNKANTVKTLQCICAVNIICVQLLSNGASISYQNCLYNLDCLSSNGTSWSCKWNTSSLALHLLSLLPIVSANNSQKSFLLRLKLHLWYSFSIHECRILSSNYYNSVQSTAVGSMFNMDFVKGSK